MKIESVFDPSFWPYGQVLAGYDTAALVRAMEEIPLPETGTAYQPSIPALEKCAVFGQLWDNAYGGMPIQTGLCWSRNTKLNCLEYHRDSEVNIGISDFILLLAKQEEIVDGKLDTAGSSMSPPGQRWRSMPPLCTTSPVGRSGRADFVWRLSCPGVPTRK